MRLFLKIAGRLLICSLWKKRCKMNPLVHYAVAFLGPQYVADRLATDRGNGVLESDFQTSQWIWECVCSTISRHLPPEVADSNQVELKGHLHSSCPFSIRNSPLMSEFFLGKRHLSVWVFTWSRRCSNYHFKWWPLINEASKNYPKIGRLHETKDSKLIMSNDTVRRCVCE